MAMMRWELSEVSEEADRELVEEIARGLVAPVPNPATIEDVPGWFSRADQDLFEWILGRPTAAPQHGDVVELGTFHGKSAIHIGRFLRDADQFFVCDLFGADAPANAMSPSARAFYSQSFRHEFERNYLYFHGRLPAVIQAPTSEILQHVAAGSCRFVHIDASHEYENVHGDLLSARELLGPGGVVALDDYRAEHTPGTAAAVWEAVATGGLRLICLSEDKLYGTWEDPAAVQDDLVRAASQAGNYVVATHRIMDQPVIRVVRRRETARGVSRRR
jgi:hypothetical protein